MNHKAIVVDGWKTFIDVNTTANVSIAEVLVRVGISVGVSVTVRTLFWVICPRLGSALGPGHTCAIRYI